MRKARVNRAALRNEISLLLRKMAFSHTAVKICEEEAKAPQEEFLLKILKREMANREDVRKARFLREAAFPVYKTFEGFDFSSMKLPPALLKQEMMTTQFVAEKRNLVSTVLWEPGKRILPLRSELLRVFARTAQDSLLRMNSW
jgi:DNA replication protein DnaC